MGSASPFRAMFSVHPCRNHSSIAWSAARSLGSSRAGAPLVAAAGSPFPDEMRFHLGARDRWRDKLAYAPLYLRALGRTAWVKQTEAEPRLRIVDSPGAQCGD